MDQLIRIHRAVMCIRRWEEPYYILKTNNPYTFYVSDGYDPDLFMPWVHPFTTVISGPTGSGKSVFVRRFVHNIKHMMTPIPDRFLWCYGEYQTVYGTVDGVNFQQGLPDLNTLDPREKTFNHPRRPHGRNGSKSSFFVYEEESPQKHQCHVHRSESVSSRKTPWNNKSQCPLHGRLQKPRDVSQIMALAHQMYPQRKKYFLEAYTAATARPHGYLVIDMKQETSWD